MPLAIALHTLSAVVWVGGMFFAYVALRPVAAGVLEAPQRLTLWEATLGRFFRWVWVAVALLLGTGLWMVLRVFGGFAHVGLYVHVMLGLGLVMMALYAHVYFAPYRRLKRDVAAGDWKQAARWLAQIRRIVGINLILGLIVVAVGSGGRYFGGF